MFPRQQNLLLATWEVHDFSRAVRERPLVGFSP